MKHEQKINAPKMHGPAGRGGTGEKAKNFKKSIKQLLIHLKPYWLPIITALIFACAGTVFSILGPKILSKITEEIILGILPGASINFVKITTIGLWIVALYLVSALFSFIQNFIMAKVTAKISKGLREDISKKINRLPLKYYDSTSYGDILSRVTNDVDTISQTLSQSLSQMITSITMLIGIVVMMFTISWQLTLVALISVPVSTVLVMIFVKISQKHFRKQQNALGELNGHIEETYSAHNVVKVFSGEEKAEEKFDGINEELYKSGYKAQFFSGLMMPMMNFVGNISYVVICIIGGAMALNDITFIASIVAFIQYIHQFNQPIQQVASIAGTLQSTAAAAERVFEFLGEEELSDESDKNATIKNFKGKVEFKNVSFGYTPEKEIIHNFSETALPGQKVAIVGPTGAGKTTIVNLLMRFYEINSGEILIDGVSTKDMKRSYVRSLFGMVLQDTWLFEGTIRENIAYGKPDATDEEIHRACEAANIDHFIKTQPGSYNMVLDEDANLSQGQKQLLTIARAMVENAPMLILDEATSSVDTRTEELIQEAMDKLIKGRTSFVIAHRLSTIKNADLILVMKDGNVIETGKHEELLAKNGFYADLYNSQFTKKHAEVDEG
ncbi:MAG TPA: ABC transporter ATP-binding protein [Candidatus Caccopulliclostridium gallistercoris]|uniref:ABC transporter ATP-binding protein n=1 Tax=Candidatus Caccopulliclostridium gallistercoris TaxID=2840719 RepID=A0A9D1NEK7_9FIRM|nr:ABC transporter ATP-binding protein [Candidatus Caccopulliclostridium gallistercoris]